MKKPNWWTGWWLLKWALAWFAIFVVWQVVSTWRPESTAAKLLGLLFGLFLLPLVASYGLGVVAD